jgi:hypothetical protein
MLKARLKILFKRCSNWAETTFRPRKARKQGSKSSLVVQEVSGMETEVVEVKIPEVSESDREIIRARRTAFVARFIVLREGKRTKAHRAIEMMEWEDLTTVEELAGRFRQEFVENGDVMMPVDRDLRRSLAHSYRSLKFFVKEYARRATLSFIAALEDYGFSNELLFSDEDQPRSGGWRLPRELKKIKAEREVAAKSTHRGARKGRRDSSEGTRV